MKKFLRWTWIKTKDLLAAPKLRRKGFGKWYVFHAKRAVGIDLYQQGGWRAFFSRPDNRRYEELASLLVTIVIFEFGLLLFTFALVVMCIVFDQIALQLGL